MENKQDVMSLKKVYSQLAFLHEILTQRTQFFVSEFELAKDATQLVTSQANALADQIKAMAAPVEVVEITQANIDEVAQVNSKKD